MVRATRWICWGLILAGLLSTPSLAPAQGKNDPPREVIDEAGLFSKQAIRDANAEIADIKRTYHKDVLVETRKEGVPNDQYEAWAEKRMKDFRVNGIYIVITLQPRHHAAIQLGNATRSSGEFTEANREEAQRILLRDLGKNRDQALLQTLHYIRGAFRTNTAAKSAGAAPPVTQPAEPGVHQEHAVEHTGTPWRTAGIGIGGFICIALAIIAVIWLVIGVIRAMFAPRYPAGPGGGGYGGGGGYAPGYGGGYGGGGGGFFSSLLGGMFGAAAGMWMYNNFFGGHSYGGGYGGGYPTGTPGPTSGGYANAGTNPDQPNDVAAGNSGDGGGDWGDSDKQNVGGSKDGGDAGGDAGGDTGGGDWGGDAGGGDAGGGDTGGGDWGGGGGGDAGGGDWGGGGGDTGGGDWGGGGGGDFGGGGGGGGDW